MVTPENSEDVLRSIKTRLSGHRYLLVALSPYYEDAEGEIWLDPLWHRDLSAHMTYLSDLTVLSARAPMPESTSGLTPIRGSPCEAVRFVELPSARSVAHGVSLLPRTFAVALKAVRQADVVHSGVAGWPIPPGLIVNPLAVLLRRRLVIVVESAFWRLSGAGPHGVNARLRASTIEAFCRWSVRRAKLSVFTQAEYKAAFSRGASAPGLVNPATLLDDEDVLTAEAAASAWDSKGAPVRLVFAGRLTPSKGVLVLFEALRLAEARGVELHVTVIGVGELEAAAREVAASLKRVRLTVLDPIPYGPEFLVFLRGFHAAIVPTLSDEQPRIIFDAFSQAVPVLGSDTAGNRDLVVDGVSGWLTPAGNAEALFEAVVRASSEAGRLRQMGMAARNVASKHTRHAMHFDRARSLVEALA